MSYNPYYKDITSEYQFSSIDDAILFLEKLNHKIETHGPLDDLCFICKNCNYTWDIYPKELLRRYIIYLSDSEFFNDKLLLCEELNIRAIIE
jgi:hypothetical protein